MEFSEVMQNLEQLGSERIKKQYINNGAKEPLFGVTIGKMKPMAKTIKINQALAEELYNTGNYDAMYFAGIIADAKSMTENDFERWIDKAYFPMLSDYVVAVTLAESNLAMPIANKWINSNEELKISAGFNTYCWLLGSRKDSEFDIEEIRSLLHQAKDKIQQSTECVKFAIESFISAVGVSYIPLHAEAFEIAKELSSANETLPANQCKIPVAVQNIEKAIAKGQIGFKRKNVRC